ncbi:uncharacterized protein LOC143021608 [Oratosquilla oratoria]|uniref:uncharacterized protein LOC143021608 n=1 Tax=Oratosquilla oratoria TaxID=337810 RepID=UPI003F776CD6
MEENRGFLDNQKLSLSELMGLISLCVDSTFFRFRDHTYHQRKGTPMGSPMSVMVAEVGMQRLEAQLLSAAHSSLKLRTRYIDDVFAILDSKDVEPFFSHINSIETAIQFSLEPEKYFQLPFLDVCVKREGDTLKQRPHITPRVTIPISKEHLRLLQESYETTEYMWHTNPSTPSPKSHQTAGFTSPWFCRGLGCSVAIDLSRLQ